MPAAARKTARAGLGILCSLAFPCALLCASAPAAGESADQQIQGVFSELRALKPMAPGRSYTVSVAGRRETGPKEQFLRRRTAQEISESGLSCGCGDYALLFIARAVPLGFEALLVDGAELSSESLQEHFSGHCVVAIRGAGAAAHAPWWLVDPTNMRLLERSWSPAARSFEAFDTTFWIGYCGPLADYPIHDAGELKAFYARTLEAVPLEFMNDNLCKLDFTVDRSLVGADGAFLNPRIPDLLRMQARILAARGISPLRKVSILLTRGNDDFTTDLGYSDERGWVGRLGLRSACSPGLLTYFERTLRRHYGPALY